MILILSENADPKEPEYGRLMEALRKRSGIQVRIHRIEGELRAVTEVYLIGDTKQLSLEEMQALPCVERVVRVSEEYRILGRHRDDTRPSHFEYQGLRFGPGIRISPLSMRPSRNAARTSSIEPQIWGIMRTPAEMIAACCALEIIPQIRRSTLSFANSWARSKGSCEIRAPCG